MISSTSVSAAMSIFVSAPTAIASASRISSLLRVVDCGFGAENGMERMPSPTY